VAVLTNETSGVDCRLSKDVLRDLDRTHRGESEHYAWDGRMLRGNVATLTVIILSFDVSKSVDTI